MKQTYWLYYGDDIAAIACMEGNPSTRDVQLHAAHWHERVPLTLCGHTPHEHLRKILNSRVVKHEAH